MFLQYFLYLKSNTMKIESNNLTFQSKIKFIDSGVFKEKISKLNPKIHEVGYPWNPDTMKKGKNLFTTSIMDCIAGGVVDNNSVTMFHMCTLNQAQAKKNRLKGFDIKNFGRRLLEKIDLTKENLHGFILGGFQMEENSKYNVNKLRKIKKVFEENQIPYSIFGARRDVHYFGRYSILYDNKEDTLYITNSLAGQRGLNGKGKELEVLGNNRIFYHTYTKTRGKYGVDYIRKEYTGSTEDYLKSQFRDVSLCKLDSFV